MTSPTVIVTYGARAVSTSESIWLHLEQPPWSRDAQLAGFQDITQMWQLAIQGKSARNHRASTCPATLLDGIVTIPVDIYVYPSPMNLNYQLTASIGDISQAKQEDRPHEFDIIFDAADSVELPYLVSSFSYALETPVFDGLGRKVSAPAVSCDGHVVRLSKRCTVVMRVKCLARGYKHRVTMRLVKYEKTEDEDGTINWTGYSITNLKNVVQATWVNQGELQQEKLDLKFPPCVLDLLALCDNGEPEGDISLNPGDDPVPVVWWSTCTGDDIGGGVIKP